MPPLRRLTRVDSRFAGATLAFLPFRPEKGNVLLNSCSCNSASTRTQAKNEGCIPVIAGAPLYTEEFQPLPLSRTSGVAVIPARKQVFTAITGMDPRTGAPRIRVGNEGIFLGFGAQMCKYPTFGIAGYPLCGIRDKARKTDFGSAGMCLHAGVQRAARRANRGSLTRKGSLCFSHCDDSSRAAVTSPVSRGAPFYAWSCSRNAKYPMPQPGWALRAMVAWQAMQPTG